MMQSLGIKSKAPATNLFGPHLFFDSKIAPQVIEIKPKQKQNQRLISCSHLALPSKSKDSQNQSQEHIIYF